MYAVPVHPNHAILKWFLAFKSIFIWLALWNSPLALKTLGSDMNLLEVNCRDRQVPNVVKQIRSEMWGCICPHQDRERAEGCGGIGFETERSYLWTDIWKKQRPLSPCMPLILIPFVSVRQYFEASFVSALVSHRSAPCVEYIIRQRLFHIRPGLIYQWHGCLCLYPMYH